MREVGYMERRLRATALAPGVRQEHFDVLRAKLRARTRSRQRRPILVAVASVVFMTLVVFQNQPLESFNHGFDYFEALNETLVVALPYESASHSVIFSRSNRNGSLPVGLDEAPELARKWGRAEELFMAGRMPLEKVLAYTLDSKTRFSLFYEVEDNGEVFDHMEFTDEGDEAKFTLWMTSPEFHSLFNDMLNRVLPELETKTIELDGNMVTLQRWLGHDPNHGEVVFWVSQSIN